jgi:predicted Zn-dependent protease
MSLIFLGLSLPALGQSANGLSGRAIPSKSKAKKKRSKKELKAAREMLFADFLMNVERDYAAAAKQYTKVLAIDKKHRGAHMGLVGAQMQRKDYKSALVALTKLTKYYPQDVWAWITKADIHLLLSQTKEAVEVLTTALEIDSRYAPALRRLGDIHFTGLRQANSKKAVAIVIALYESYLANTRHRYGGEARRIERALVELRDGPAAAGYLDGKRLYERAFQVRRGMTPLLMQSYQKLDAVLLIAPTHKGALYYQGLIHMTVKSSERYNLKDARAKFEAAGDHAPSLTKLGRLARLADDLERAEAYLKRAVKFDSRHQEAQMELARTYKLQGARKAAVKAFQAAFDISPRSSLAGKAAVELSIIAPSDPRVFHHYRKKGRFEEDIFNTEKFKVSLAGLERRLGGVDTTAPEQEWLDSMMRRLLAAADFSVSHVFQVQVVKTKRINAFAAPNGNIYFTRGFLNMVREMFPGIPMDENNGPIASVMGHEITHVTKEHIVRSHVFRDAMNAGRIRSSHLVSVTRTHEIEADREGMRLLFLAGYDPRHAVRMFEAYAKKLGEIPAGLDHPTFDERIHYLEEYWGNEMAFAYASFNQGLQHVEQATTIEGKDLNAAAALLKEAIADFKRFATAFKHTSEALNNLGFAYAKLGFYWLAKHDAGNALFAWYTRFSVEPRLAMQFVPLKPKRTRRGADVRAAVKIPSELRRAATFFKKAIKLDEGYARARYNYAAVLLALGRFKEAEHQLARVKADCREGCGVPGHQVDNLLSVARAEMGQIKEAISYFSSSEHGEQRVYRLFNLAIAKERSSDITGAKEAYESFIAQAKRLEGQSLFVARAQAALKRLD